MSGSIRRPRPQRPDSDEFTTWAVVVGKLPGCCRSSGTLPQVCRNGDVVALADAEKLRVSSGTPFGPCLKVRLVAVMSCADRFVARSAAPRALRVPMARQGHRHSVPHVSVEPARFNDVGSERRSIQSAAILREELHLPCLVRLQYDFSASPQNVLRAVQGTRGTIPNAAQLTSHFEYRVHVVCIPSLMRTPAPSVPILDTGCASPR